MKAPRSRLLRTALRRGVMEGSRTWLVIGGATLAARALRKATRREEEVVFREELPPGTALLIGYEDPVPPQ